jgi:DinB superfamily
VTDRPALPATADGLRRLNDDLDQQLLAYLDQVEADPTPHTDDAWSTAQILAHVAEFSPFFTGQLAGWLSDRDQVVGRTTSHTGRLAAVEPSRVATLTRAGLEADLRAALAETRDVLAGLADADLTAPTQNVKYGTEPLTAFLSRYLVGHKQEHVDQLRDLAGSER